MIDPIAFHARTTPDKIACIDLEAGLCFSYREFDAAVARLAGCLAQRLGPASGKRVVMLSKNSATFVMLHYACARAGAVFTPLNWRLAPPEISFLVEDSEPDLIVWESQFDALVEPSLSRFEPSARFRLEHGRDPLADAAKSAAPLHETLPKDENAPITLLYTSGTSGRPKGVIISEKSARYSTLNYALSACASGESTFLCDMPLFHVAGLLATTRTPLFFGGTLVISQKFDPKITVERLLDEDLGITHYFCVTQMAAMMREYNSPETIKRLSKLTALQTGGAPNPPASVRRWVADGVPMIDGFGMTEIGSALSMTPRDLPTIDRKAGSVGLPSMFLEARVVDENGEDVPDGVVGELWVRGPNVSPGYWRRPEETQKTFGGGWLKSGDAARRDEDGFYYIVDRTKDMYISGGENVYPVEVEAAFAELPEILDCAIVGVPDEKWGEVGVAFIQLAGEARLDEAGVLAHCRSRLAHYKAPKKVVFVDALPRTPSGKVQKHVLKADWLKSEGKA